MIIDHIEKAGSYGHLGDGFETAMQFLYEHQRGDLADGRYELNEKDFVLVQSYQSKPIEQCKFEAHRRYIDVQYMVSGFEKIGWAPTSKLTLESYDEQKDFVKLSGNGDLFPLSEGNFFILFPDDAHMPGIMGDESRLLKKIVLKIWIRPR